jgi:RimJ/RimL family protein N-acetyltransferase
VLLPAGFGTVAVVTSTERGPQPTLTGRRVQLRPWRPDDAAAVYEACQDPDIQRWTEVPVPYRRADAEMFVGEIAPRTWSDGGALLALEPAGGGPLIGSIGVHGIRDGVASVGYWTAPQQRRHGYTSEALRLLGGWALAELGAHRVELVVHPENVTSRRVAESAGFVAEGVLRQRYLHRGRPTDVVLYSLLPTDRQPEPS